MYKNYIFDVYGTLIDIHTNEHELATWQKMADTLRFYGVEYSAEDLKETYFSACELQVTKGKAHFSHPEVDVVTVFRQIFENRGKKVGKSLATHLAQQFRAFSTQYIRLYPKVAETLSKIKKAGKKLYILSNAQSCFTKTEIAKLGLRKYFSGIVYSSDVGCAKPDGKLFDYLVNKYELNRKECVYIGNDAFTDVIGAKNGKMDCLWIKTNLSGEQEPTATAPKYRIDDGNFAAVSKLLLK